MTRAEALERLRAQVEQNAPIVGAGAGTGLSAKCAEAGGADLISALFRSAIMLTATTESMRGRLAGIEFAQVASTPTLGNVASLHSHRNELMARLEGQGIATRQGTHAAALVEYYAARYDLTPDRFPRAWLADRLSLTLPLYPQMTDEEQLLVCESLSAAYTPLSSSPR